MTLTPITPDDFPKIRHILRAAVETEESLSLKRDCSDDDMAAYFFGDGSYEYWAYVDAEHGEILGIYHLRANQKHLGSHIANGGYIVSPSARGKGIGRKMGEHSIVRAREKGYRGIQYNFVISTNTVAVKLWKSLGFRIIGTIPGGYHRKQQEFVDAYIMFQSL